MQLKSVFMLCTGLALGWMMFQKDDKKEKTVNHFKKVMYKLQTGNDYPKPEKKPNYNHTYSNNRTTYRSYYHAAKPESNDDDIKDFTNPTFNSEEEAREVYNKIFKIATDCGSVSALDLYYSANDPAKSKWCSWKWDRYGWQWSTIAGASITQTDDGKWVIMLPAPSFLAD